MDEATLRQRCDLLRSLHVSGTPLILPNAWDAASARAVVEAGFPAVATSSGAVAATLGYEDEEAAPVLEMMAAAGRIARAVDVPVTADAEAGYGLSPEELVGALRDAGAAGCNLEDTDHGDESLADPVRHAERLTAIRGAADARGYGLVINARIDVFLNGGGDRPSHDQLDQAIARAGAYREAGVDCVYPIFLRDAEAVAAFIRGTPGPVNILATPDAPPPAKLAELGVARISYGSGIHHRSLEDLAATLMALPMR